MTAELLESLKREPTNRAEIERLVPRIEAAEAALKSATETEAKETRRGYLAEQEFAAAKKKFNAAEEAAVAASLEPDDAAFITRVKVAANLRAVVRMRGAGVAQHREGALRAARRAAITAELALTKLRGHLNIFAGDIVLAETIRAHAAASEANGSVFVLNDGIVGTGTKVAEHRKAWAETLGREQELQAELKGLDETK
jgi:hypothetical protein